MGPEIIAAIVGPATAALLSTFLWIGKRNADKIDKGFEGLQSSVAVVERKVEDLGLEVAKEYVTTEWMIRQMQREDARYQELNDRIDGIREDLRDHVTDSNEMNEKFRNDISEVKDMQWKMRMDMLDMHDQQKDLEK